MRGTAAIRPSSHRSDHRSQLRDAARPEAIPGTSLLSIEIDQLYGSSRQPTQNRGFGGRSADDVERNGVRLPPVLAGSRKIDVGGTESNMQYVVAGVEGLCRSPRSHHPVTIRTDAADSTSSLIPSGRRICISDCNAGNHSATEAANPRRECATGPCEEFLTNPCPRFRKQEPCFPPAKPLAAPPLECRNAANGRRIPRTIRPSCRPTSGLSACRVECRHRKHHRSPHSSGMSQCFRIGSSMFRGSIPHGKLMPRAWALRIAAIPARVRSVPGRCGSS